MEAGGGCGAVVGIVGLDCDCEDSSAVDPSAVDPVGLVDDEARGVASDEGVVEPDVGAGGGGGPGLGLTAFFF